MDELELRKTALVPNSAHVRCPLCENLMYPNTIKHFCGTKEGECRIDQIKCVHCSKIVIMVENEILNPQDKSDTLCQCYNSIEYESTHVKMSTLIKFLESTNCFDNEE